MKKYSLAVVMFFAALSVFSQLKPIEIHEIALNLPKMKPIVGGVFPMGTDTFLHKVEEQASPIHLVELSNFIIAETLVTQRLWDLYIQDTGYPGYTYYNGYYGTVWENIKGPDSPAIFMTWSEAVVFCNWLSERFGLIPAYRISGALNPDLRGGIEVQWIRGTNGYRLITEAEWEYVMYERGSPREKLIEVYKNSFDRPRQKPLPDARSGQFTSFNIIAYPNSGLSEMTWDELGSFAPELQKDPTGVSGLHSQGHLKVRRYFRDQVLYHRLSMRIAGGEGEFIGIRLAQDRL